jgi:hypothetical protein
MTMMRYYLLTLFVIPMLDLFDRWKARLTETMDEGGAFDTTRLFGWHRYEGESGKDGWHTVKVFHLHIPFVRVWQEYTTLANFALGHAQGFCRKMLVHVVVRGPKHNENRWYFETIPPDILPR